MARLDRAAVLTGAWTYIEAHGVDALTMRKLAASLGVNHGTLYWHVENKHALVDALADDLLAGVADPPYRGTAGMERLTELAHRLRAALLSHRDGARILAGTFVRESHTLTFGEAAIGAALDAGVSEQDAVLLAFSVQYYVTGFAIEEQAAQQLEHPENARVRRDIDETRFPLVRAGLEILRNTPPDKQFDYGLRQLLKI
ncbi:TetR family transcriptional regulator [Mycobacteroides immunogenum]|uniref:TetR family transcriptional regulator n=1 Tax=Mycobacteroides immunogenum TaxID=83262 RepID=A0A179VEH9_9MYCO|nr:TetR/AcrR family transcriptional regulator C-terminal domain-containing protein [Mycobacteroides immunogenum]OAT69552.1 TetR family transcriptional regulator [Mycobacteroides immunogenum]